MSFGNQDFVLELSRLPPDDRKIKQVNAFFPAWIQDCTRFI